MAAANNVPIPQEVDLDRTEPDAQMRTDAEKSEGSDGNVDDDVDLKTMM